MCGRMQESLIEKSWLILGNMSLIDQGSTLDLATRLRAGQSRARIPVATRVFFLLSKSSDRLWGHPAPIKCLPQFFPGGKADGA
jgi:hypothetical protein